LTVVDCYMKVPSTATAMHQQRKQYIKTLAGNLIHVPTFSRGSVGGRCSRIGYRIKPVVLAVHAVRRLETSQPTCAIRSRKATAIAYTHLQYTHTSSETLDSTASTPRTILLTTEPHAAPAEHADRIIIQSGKKGHWVYRVKMDDCCP